MNPFQSGHALIVGVGADLPTTVDDAQGLVDILTDAGRCAYPPEQVQLLTGPAATRDAVLSALDALAQRTAADSTVVVYFSGHGYTVSTSTDDLYFLMPYGYDLHRLKTTAIKGAEFAARLRAIPAQKLLVLLDCCHAGGVGAAKAPGIEALSKAPLPPEALDLLTEGRGRVLIASSREDELSYAGKPYSAFTLALTEALCGTGVAKKDGYVRIADVALHTRQVVPGRTNDKQHPILHFEHADNFVLAYYAGGATQPKGLPFAVETIEIEPEPGAWQVGGDVVRGDKTTLFDQRGQTVGTQTNIAGNVTGPLLSGHFDGPVAVGGGETVNLSNSQGAVYKPTGPVEQHFGDNIHITGDGNVLGNDNRVDVQNGGIRARRIEAENVVDGVQIQNGAPADVHACIELAQSIERGGISADEIRAGSVVSGVQFLTGKPPADRAELQAELAALRKQVQAAIEGEDLESTGDVEDLNDALSKAETELEQPEPDGRRVVRHLKSVTEILTELADSTEAVREAGWQLVKLAPVAAALWRLAQTIF